MATISEYRARARKYVICVVRVVQGPHPRRRSQRRCIEGEPPGLRPAKDPNRHPTIEVDGYLGPLPDDAIVCERRDQFDVVMLSTVGERMVAHSKGAFGVATAAHTSSSQTWLEHSCLPDVHGAPALDWQLPCPSPRRHADG
ncbi:MAG: hypothetical protein IPM54_32205 [Polyangiaceae bacterium]|nr:hypothetical protein [Polyangiaceae bacterium]